jgi:pimeloyl-ACP methyl ester carboxylesterase
MKLIFIHGSGACGDIWYYQKKFFKGADAPNLPGHPAGEFCTRIEEYADWLHGYIQSFHDKDVVLAGHSMGGGIVLMYSLMYPQDLKAAISVASGAKLRVKQAILDRIREGLTNEASWMRDFVEPLYRTVDEKFRKMLLPKLEAVGPAAQLNDFLCCDKFDIMDKIGQIKIPVLAIVGDQDNMTPPKYSQYLDKNISNCRLVLIENAGHHCFMEKPEQVNHSIADFLKEQGY